MNYKRKYNNIKKINKNIGSILNKELEYLLVEKKYKNNSININNNTKDYKINKINKVLNSCNLIIKNKTFNKNKNITKINYEKEFISIIKKGMNINFNKKENYKNKLYTKLPKISFLKIKK